VQLAFREIDFGGCAIGVEQARAHADRDLVEVADLAEDLVGRLAQAGEATLLRHGAAIPEQQILLGEPARDDENLLAGAARERAAVGETTIVPRLVREPEPTHVLDAVERHPTGHVEVPPVIFEGRDVRLNDLVVHGVVAARGRPFPLAKESPQGREEEAGLLNVRHMPAIFQHETLGAQRPGRVLRGGEGDRILPAVDHEGG
jgi:hypothetical protein